MLHRRVNGKIKVAYTAAFRPLIPKSAFRRIWKFINAQKRKIRVLVKQRRYYVNDPIIRPLERFMERLIKKQTKVLTVKNFDNNVIKALYRGTQWSKFFGTSVEHHLTKEKNSPSYKKISTKAIKYKPFKNLGDNSKKFQSKVSKAYFICKQIAKSPLIVKNFRTYVKNINESSLNSYIEFNKKIYTYLIFRNIYNQIQGQTLTPRNIKATILKRIYDNRYVL